MLHILLLGGRHQAVDLPTDATGQRVDSRSNCMHYKLQLGSLRSVNRLRHRVDLLFILFLCARQETWMSPWSLVSVRPEDGSAPRVAALHDGRLTSIPVLEGYADVADVL